MFIKEFKGKGAWVRARRYLRRNGWKLTNVIEAPKFGRFGRIAYFADKFGGEAALVGNRRECSAKEQL